MQIPTDMLQTQGIFKVVEDGISQNIGVLLGFKKKKDICSRFFAGDPKFWKPWNPWNPWSPVRVRPQPPMGGVKKPQKGLLDGTLGPHQNLVPRKEGPGIYLEPK